MPKAGNLARQTVEVCKAHPVYLHHVEPAKSTRDGTVNASSRPPSRHGFGMKNSQVTTQVRSYGNLHGQARDNCMVAAQCITAHDRNDVAYENFVGHAVTGSFGAGCRFCTPPNQKTAHTIGAFYTAQWYGASYNVEEGESCHQNQFHPCDHPRAAQPAASGLPPTKLHAKKIVEPQIRPMVRATAAPIAAMSQRTIPTTAAAIPLPCLGLTSTHRPLNYMMQHHTRVHHRTRILLSTKICKMARIKVTINDSSHPRGQTNSQDRMLP